MVLYTVFNGEINERLTGIMKKSFPTGRDRIMSAHALSLNINFHEFTVNFSKNILDNLWAICGN